MAVEFQDGDSILLLVVTVSLCGVVVRVSLLVVARVSLLVVARVLLLVVMMSLLGGDRG